MKKRLYKLLCLICALTAMLSAIPLPAHAEGIIGKAASVFGYALNDEMFRSGVIDTAEPGGDADMSKYDGNYPTGVIYSDIIYFDNNESPYLVIFRADGAAREVCADIYRYDDTLQRAENIASLRKGYNSDEGVEGQFALGVNGSTQYIIYREYTHGIETNAEYYTVINGIAYRYIKSPPCSASSGIVNWNTRFFRPYVDVSGGNIALSTFFSKLKDASAESVTYEDIAEKITPAEEESLESVLTEAARFSSFDIGEYSSLTDYELALTERDIDDKFYLITNLYNIGDEIYYVRFSTDRSFYNYAILRHTDDDGKPYQLLASRTDSIPLSDIELTRLREIYSRNKLVAGKASESIQTAEKPFLPLMPGGEETEKPIKLPKLFNASVKRPAALVYGVLAITSLIVLWVFIASDDDEERYEKRPRL